MTSRRMLARILIASASLSLASCSNWDYMFCNPFDPDAEYDVVYKDATVAGHTVSGGEKWSGTISLTGSVVVPHDTACLVILPGTIVTVASGSNYSITVQAGGGFYAMGTASEPIVFKSGGSGQSDWAGIAADGAMQLDYCLIKDAANGLQSRAIDSQQKVRVANSCFANCFMGLQFDGAQSCATLTGLSFDSCNTGIFAKSSAWSYCDFKSCSAAAANVAGDGEILKFSYTNFTGNTQDVCSSFSGTSVSLDYCYPASPSIAASVTPTITNQQSGSVVGAGCGFDYTKY